MSVLLLVAERGFEPPLALLRCPKKSSRCSLARFLRPLRQQTLPVSSTGRGRVCCPGNPSVRRQNTFQIEKKQNTKRCSVSYWLRRGYLMGSAHHSQVPCEHPIVFAFGEGRFKSPVSFRKEKQNGHPLVSVCYWVRRGDLNLLTSGL